MNRVTYFSAHVQRRMAANHLGIILDDFGRDLGAAGYSRSTIQKQTRIVEHFGSWLGRRRVRAQQVTRKLIDDFVRLHLPRCRCPEPAPATVQRCRGALNRLLGMLQRRGLVALRVEPLSPFDRLIQRFDDHLQQTCGLSGASRLVYCRFSRQFLLSCFGRRSPRPEQIRRADLLRYVEYRAKNLRPRSLKLLVTSLRSFLRFLQTQGRVKSSLIAAVPSLPAWERTTAPPTLSRMQVTDLLRSFDRSTPLGRRDFAMTLCMTELGLRVSEVAQVSLDDLDWRKGTIRLAKNKSGRERLLPLPPRLGRALVSYLRHGRPRVAQRQVFLCHHFPLGTPLRPSQVGYAIRQAYARAGIPATKVHLLRHTFATHLHQQGASVKALADLLGHKSLESTTIYTRVNLKQLRLVALPWPRSAS